MPKIVAMSSTSIVDVFDGNSVVETIIEYAVSSNGRIPPGNPMTDGSGTITDMNGVVLTDGSWSTEIPTITEGQWLWTRTRTIYSDGQFTIVYTVSRSGENGAQGQPGIGYTAQKEQWYLSTSPNELAGGSWLDTEPSEIPDGKYLWGRLEYTMSDGSTRYSDAVYRSMISGLVSLADEVNKKITQKVWTSDIDNSINSYDGSTGKSIRDRVTKTEQDISTITSTVSDVQSTLSQKADGSTVTTLQQTVSTNEQTASQFRRTVTSNYAKLTDVDTKINNIKIGGNNLYVIKDEVPGYIHANSGAISTQSTAKEVTSAFIPVKPGESYIIQSWATPSTAGKSWLAYQYYSDNSGTPFGRRVDKYGDTLDSGVEVTADGQEHLTYKITIPNDVSYLRMSYRKYNDGYAMIEKATTPSEYSMNPEDLQAYSDSVVNSAKSEIKQTTDNITAQVQTKVGNDEIISKINLSQETATIQASKVDLIGHVTFSMLDNSAQSKINAIETSAGNSSTWINSNGNNLLTAKNIINNWAVDATSTTTTIKGGLIAAHTITANQLATNAIMSTNYEASTNLESPYSKYGTFLDLSNGNFWTPNFGVINITPTGTEVPTGAWFNGTVYANAGLFGDKQNNRYWRIENVTDYNTDDHAALVGVGNAYLQTQNWQVNDSAVQTRKYVYTDEYSGQSTYYKDVDTNTYYDVGMKIPTDFNGRTENEGKVTTYNRSFFYGRKYTNNNLPELDSQWTYFFMVDNEGNIYEHGQKLSELYAPISGDAGSHYVMTKGNNTIEGNLTVTGTLTATASSATKVGHSLSINNKSFDGQEAVDVGTIGVGYGGTGKTSWTANRIVYASATNALSQLAAGTSGQILKSNGSSAPGWINQSAIAAGSATNDANGDQIDTTYRKLSNTTYDTISVATLTVSGTASFTSGLTGDLTGDVIGDVSGSAGSVVNSLKIQLNGGTTEGTNQFTYNGSGVKNINITKSSIGLGNVDNTADANKNVLSATKFTSAQSITLTGDTTGTASSQAGWSIATTTNQLSTIGNIRGDDHAVAIKAYFNANKENVPRNKLINFYSSAYNNGSLAMGYFLTGYDNIPYGGFFVSHYNKAYYVGIENGTYTQQKLVTSTNYTDYTVTKTGSGATGTWGISISGGSAVWSIGRTLTIGDTGKTVDGSANVSWSKAEISEEASASANGWMSSADKTKLTGIEAGAQVNTITGIKGNSESTYRTGNVNITAANIGLGNLTNNKQVKGLSSGTTSGHLVTWGSDGYTVADSGISKGNIVKSVASDSDGKLVLTYADDTTSDPITVQFVATEASSVSFAEALNVNGVAVGSATQPVYFDNTGKPTLANKIPKLNGASSDSAFYAPTSGGTSGQYLKSNGNSAPTWASFSKSTVGLGNVDNTADANKNVLTATKFNSTRKIELTGDVTGSATTDGSSGWSIATTVADNSHNHYPNNISCGNSSMVGNLDPVTGAYIGSAASNKTFGLPANAIVIEYSTNGGSTWTDYGATDEQKRGLFAETRGTSFILGKSSSASTNTTNNRLRVTIEPTDRYVSLHGIYVWLSTSGSTVYMDLERSTIGAKDTFTTVFTGQQITGWSGNNIRYFSQGAFGGGSTQTSNTYKYRITFYQTAVNTSHNSASVSDIRFLGTNVWSSPNNMVSKNHLYTWDINLNASFPAQVTATQFNGSLNGNAATATSATTATTANSATKATQDGSGNVITDTYVKKSGDTITGTLILSRTTDLSGTANNKPALIVGGTDAQAHLEFDSNEIQAKGSGTTAASLYLNNDGGTIYLGPNITASGTTVTATTFSGNATTATTASRVSGVAGTTNADRHVWFSDSAAETARNYDDDFKYNPSTNTLTVANVSGTATKANQDGDGNTISSTYAKLSGATFTGAVTGTSFAANVVRVGVSGNTSGSTTGGIALYDVTPSNYGIAMRQTSNGGKHGYVQGNWAIYSYMSGADNRGWILKNNTVGATVASVDNTGNAAFNGEVSIGTSGTNIDGSCSLVMNRNLGCLDFVFN